MNHCSLRIYSAPVLLAHFCASRHWDAPTAVLQDSSLSLRPCLTVAAHTVACYVLLRAPATCSTVCCRKR